METTQRKRVSSRRTSPKDVRIAAAIKGHEKNRETRGKVIRPKQALIRVLTQVMESPPAKFTTLMEAIQTKGTATKLDKHYTFRTSEKEMKQMRKKADKYGLSVSDYLRLAMFALDGE